ncbi:glucosamine inositolphosphorylceramide transferase family protein [Komagataeibacter oboediens]|uniref:glucosamine inositolphosphorylceramide transferase family protein n=1 Tax=Komagataeibacter oboediens TaxID=65958 RepID=UPI001908951F|nr:formyl transferase [Komagataeibacter oboediens]GCE80606.1 hypothetical protein MSKU3_2081 [Komagataeibacter oboediens]
MGLGRTDIWQTGLIHRSMPDVLRTGTLADMPVTWLPDPGPFRFIADPFGIWHEDRLYLFAEAYDYRVKVGRIDVFILDRTFRVIAHSPVLVEPWHLSYPVILRDRDGSFLMMPESGKSGVQRLYRATDFPYRWKEVEGCTFPGPMIDASPLFHDGRWWLFHTPWHEEERPRVDTLHVAWADSLTGPWHPHPANPVRRDTHSARPGGTPVVMDDGTIILPTQDCARTYGGAITPLAITTLTIREFAAHPLPPLTAPPAWRPATDGLHTLSAAGPVTLVDAKQTSRSVIGRAGVDIHRMARKLTRRTPRY